MAKLLQIDHEGQAKWTWWKRESEKSERRNLEYLNRSLKLSANINDCIGMVNRFTATKPDA